MREQIKKAGFLGILFLLFVGSVNAGIFMQPQAGLSINNNGDTFTTLGATLGYKLADLVSVESTYLYIDRADDKNLVDLGVALDIPFIPIIDPYIEVGTSLYPNVGDVKVGAGVTFSPPFLDIVYIGAGFDYYLVKDGDDFSFVFAMAGVSF